MQVVTAGASGAVSRGLLPLVLGAGHQVTGMTRFEDKASGLRASGVDAVVANALDRAAVVAAVAKATPEVVVHQLTALSSFTNLRRFDREFEATNLLRTQGTMTAAARAADARWLVAQSFAGWPYARSGGPVKTEEDELDPDPPARFQGTLDAMRYLERAVFAAEGLDGVVLRYGAFYGPGTSLGEGGKYVEAVRQRRFPIIGGGTGVSSFIRIENVASATLSAIEGGAAGIYNIVDDEPAPVAEWLRFLPQRLAPRRRGISRPG